MRMFLTLLASLVFVSVILLSCQPSSEKNEADVAAIKAVTEAWEAAVQSGDVAALVALRTDDMVQLPPDAPILRGKQILDNVYRGLFDQVSLSHASWPVDGTEEIVVADGWAYHMSEYSFVVSPKAGGEALEEHGKMIAIFRKEPDGSWKIAREIWNRNSPPSGVD